MTIQAIATPAGWIVEGECTCPLNKRNNNMIGLHVYVCATQPHNPSVPPSALTDAVGKACEANRCNRGHLCVQTTPESYEDVGPCSVCHGTGLASVELTVPCGALTHVKHWAHPADCVDGQVTVRGIPDKVPVPIVGERLTTTFPTGTEPPYVRVNDGCAFLHSTHHDYEFIDIGPNPAQHVGSFLVTGRAVARYLHSGRIASVSLLSNPNSDAGSVELIDPGTVAD